MELKLLDLIYSLKESEPLRLYSKVLAQLNNEINYISIGLGNNDLEEQVVKKAIQILTYNGFPNYKYDGYRGDAKEQALIYKKNK